MSVAAPALVALDCDGVLFDSWDANVGFYEAILTAMGLGPLDEAQRELAHRLSTPQILEQMFAGDAAALARAREIAAGIDYAPFLPRMRPVPRLFETLAWLTGRHHTALATNRGRTIPLLLDHFALAEHFRFVVGINDVPRPKPAPDMLLRCLAHFGVAPDAAVYVGDSPTDREAAEAAGMHFVAVGDAVMGERRIAAFAELPGLLSAW